GPSQGPSHGPFLGPAQGPWQGLSHGPWQGSSHGPSHGLTHGLYLGLWQGPSRGPSRGPLQVPHRTPHSVPRRVPDGQRSVGFQRALLPAKGNAGCGGGWGRPRVRLLTVDQTLSKKTIYGHDAAHRSHGIASQLLLCITKHLPPRHDGASPASSATKRPLQNPRGAARASPHRNEAFGDAGMG
ncbi:hypothetical protein M885DRAFT_445152, partial [Pelagophyceae sp. CCMP2097]